MRKTLVLRARQRWEFAQTTLVIHLFNHEGLPEEQSERRVAHMHEHMRGNAPLPAP